MLVDQRGRGRPGRVDRRPGRSSPGRIFARHVQRPRQLPGRRGVPLAAAARRARRSTSCRPASTGSTPTCSTSAPSPSLTIPQGQVGIVSARDGEPIVAGPAAGAEGRRPPARSRTARSFLHNGGQRGPQIEVLLPGRYRINTDLFQVEVQPATIVQANQIGLVTANDGAPLPPGELVATSRRRTTTTTRTPRRSSRTAASAAPSSTCSSRAPTTSTR